MVYVTNNSEKSSTKTTLGKAEDEDKVGKEEEEEEQQTASERAKISQKRKFSHPLQAWSEETLMCEQDEEREREIEREGGRRQAGSVKASPERQRSK